MKTKPEERKAIVDQYKSTQEKLEKVLDEYHECKCNETEYVIYKSPFHISITRAYCSQCGRKIPNLYEIQDGEGEWELVNTRTDKTIKKFKDLETCRRLINRPYFSPDLELGVYIPAKYVSKHPIEYKKKSPWDK